MTCQRNEFNNDVSLFYGTKVPICKNIETNHASYPGVDPHDSLEKCSTNPGGVCRVSSKRSSVGCKKNRGLQDVDLQGVMSDCLHRRKDRLQGVFWVL